MSRRRQTGVFRVYSNYVHTERFRCVGSHSRTSPLSTSVMYVFSHREYAGPLPLCGLANVTVSQATRIQIDKIRLHNNCYVRGVKRRTSPARPAGRRGVLSAALEGRRNHPVVAAPVFGLPIWPELELHTSACRAGWWHHEGSVYISSVIVTHHTLLVAA
jgi:hypothetical protein